MDQLNLLVKYAAIRPTARVLDLGSRAVPGLADYLSGRPDRTEMYDYVLHLSPRLDDLAGIIDLTGRAVPVLRRGGLLVWATGPGLPELGLRRQLPRRGLQLREPVRAWGGARLWLATKF